MEMFVPMIPHRWSRSSVALHDLPRARAGAPHVAVRCVSHKLMQPRACLGMCFAPVAVTIRCIWVQYDESELARRCASRAVCRVPGYVGRRREKRICTCQLLSHSDVMGPVPRYSGFDERGSSGVVQSRAWGCTHEHLMSTEAIIETKAICSGFQSPSSCSSVICIICKLRRPKVSFLRTGSPLVSYFCAVTGDRWQGRRHASNFALVSGLATGLGLMHVSNVHGGELHVLMLVVRDHVCCQS
jgi:hypothetical protein